MRFTFDLKRYVTSLCQNDERSIAEVDDICTAVQDTGAELASAVDIAVVAGKDALQSIDVALRAIKPGVTSRAMLMTFDPSMVDDYPVLRRVLDYMRG